MKYFIIIFSLLFAPNAWGLSTPPNCPTSSGTQALNYASATNLFSCNPVGGSVGINLGTSAAVANPQRNGQAGTGFYSDITNTVSVAGASQPILTLTGVSSAVDYLTITNAATANPANLIITATGTDSNQNIVLLPKGTGGVAIGTTTTAANTTSLYGNVFGGYVAMSIQNTSNGTSGAAVTLVNDAAQTGGIQLLSSNFPSSQANYVVFASQNAMEFLSNNTVSSGGSPIDFVAGGFSAAKTMRIQAGNPGTVTIGTTTVSGTSELTVNGTISDSVSTVIDAAGTGLSKSAQTLNSNAVWQANFQPGLLTSVTNTIGIFGKISKASTVDNMTASALLLTCVTNPTISFYECGTSTTCATPTTIASVQVTAAGTATPATISSSAITAGDYIGWAISAGTCTSLDIAATAQIHSN